MQGIEQYEVAIDDGVAVVTFDRPPVNAQNRQSREELVRIFDSLSAREDVRVVVLTARGKMFSAGADIKERRAMNDAPGEYLAHNRLAREAFYSVTDCQKPVVAAVNGPAMGAGFVLMLACDILLASDTAWFSMPEIDVGVAGGAKFLAQHFGRSAARTLYFTGRRVTAAELYRRGIIEAATPPEALMPTALGIAREIAAKSPTGVRLVKRTFNVIDEMPVRDAYRFEQTVTLDLAATDDTKELQAAFVEKRAPVFRTKS